MRFRFVVATVAVLLACAPPASAATIFTFSLSDGSSADPGSIQSFSFDPLGAGGTLTVTKELDTLSPIVLLAVAQGTNYPGATFSAYEDTVTPGSLLFQYAFTNAMFSSVQLGGGAQQPLEIFSLTAETVTLTRGPASVPEPAICFLIASGAGLALRRRRQHLGHAPRD